MTGCIFLMSARQRTDGLLCLRRGTFLSLNKKVPKELSLRVAPLGILLSPAKGSRFLHLSGVSGRDFPLPIAPASFPKTQPASLFVIPSVVEGSTGQTYSDCPEKWKTVPIRRCQDSSTPFYSAQNDKDERCSVTERVRAVARCDALCTNWPRALPATGHEKPAGAARRRFSPSARRSCPCPGP